MTSSIFVFGRTPADEPETVIDEKNLKDFTKFDISALVPSVLTMVGNFDFERRADAGLTKSLFEDCSTNVLLQCCPEDDVTIVEVTADCDDIDDVAGYIIDGFLSECTEECEAT